MSLPPPNSIAAPVKFVWFGAKRCVDLVLLVPLTLVLLPVAIGITVLMACQGGPVFFSQWRVGQDGRAFRLWKFRTMQPGAEGELPDLLAGNDDLSDVWQRYGKLSDDPRITPFGRMMRRYSLDELPQLWNVLVGDMSLVGPRPVPRGNFGRLAVPPRLATCPAGRACRGFGRFRGATV